MLFSSIAIKTSIPVTAPAATSGAFSVSSIDTENWLQITGEASAGAGSLYLLRWNETLEAWRVYMEDRPIAVDSSVLGGLFSAAYPFPKGGESFCLYDPAAAVTATASVALTNSPLSTSNTFGALSSIDSKTPALGQATMAASVPVVLASDQNSVPVDIEGLYQNGVREGLVTLSSANGLNVSVIEPLSDLRTEPGDVLAIAIQTASSTATVAVSVNQHEE